MTIRLASIIPVWLVSLIGSVLIGLLSPADEYFSWLSIVLAFATILTFCIQLIVRSKDGLVERMMASLGGSVLILGAATGVLAIVSG